MRIYNSLKRDKEEFVPLSASTVGIYVCGPTVYDEPHIGHARSAYIFDLISRYFKYKGYHVTLVRNITDVDDKIIEKARATGLETKEVSQKYLDAYHEDMKLLRIAKPDREPKATEYIPKMVKFIELLIEKGRAYASGGDVYFDVKQSKGYGRLSNQSPDKMEAGARAASGEKKRDALDFALWKTAKPDEPSWDSPWGRGRPGWHIECSAMSSDILGDEFDIHGGGIDLIFPHHENEMAQSEAAGKKFARVWIHNGLLTINGEKMAKSLGNFIRIKDFIAEHKDPDYLKLLFLGTHYRHPVDYSKERVAEAKSQKERFIILSEKAGRLKGCRAHLSVPYRKADLSDAQQELKIKFEEAMDDDFNTPLALASLFDAVTYSNKLIKEKDELSPEAVGEIKGIMKLISDLAGVLGLEIAKSIDSPDIDKKSILKLIGYRDAARRNKDFKKADEVRKMLLAKGIILEDTKDGTVWRRKA